MERVDSAGQRRARVLVVDDESGIRRACKRILERSGFVAITANNGNEYYYNYNDLAAGTYVWRSYANDSAGNSNISNEFSYVVSKATTVLTLSAYPSS